MLNIIVLMAITIILTLILIKMSSKLFDILESRISSVNIKFARHICTVILIIIGALVSISSFMNIDKLLNAVLAGSGIAALAVSLASQESLSNLISGFLIVICKPFDIGDKVTLQSSKVSGYIQDITFRHTVIRTFNNSHITIPNSVMNKEIIENFQLVDEKSSSFLDISVEYGTDYRLAIQILMDVIGNHPLVIDTRTEYQQNVKHKVPVVIRELGDSGVVLRATVWTASLDDNFTACSELRLAILEAFNQHGINLAYNTLTIFNK